MRILVCDDGTSGDELAHHLKMMYGAETFRAKTLAEALEKRCEIKDLDYIVFDLSYPDSSRKESLSCIPKLTEDGTPLFVLTGYEEKELLTESLLAGAQDWFLKGDNHRGAAALATRIAVHYKRKHPSRSVSDERFADQVLRVRKEQAQPTETKKWGAWLTTAHTSAAILLLLVGQLIGLIAFIYNQGEQNALFRKSVTDALQDVAVLKAQAQVFHDQNQTSIIERQQLIKRQDETDKRYDSLRADMNGGFNRIFEILLQQKSDAQRK